VTVSASPGTQATAGANGSAAPSIAIAIAGLGAIGKVVARSVVAGIPGVRLAAVGARDVPRAEAFLRALGSDAPVLPLAALGDVADLVIEALPASVFDALAEPVLRRGRTLMVISAGALLPRMHLFELAERHGARIVVPTGALIGLDAVQAAAQGTIRSVRMVTRKPPAGLEGAPHLVEHAISVQGLSAPLKVFEGTAREAVRGFPANVNVVAALSLAGIGPDRTTIEIWADPAVDRNHHRIEVDSDSAAFSMEIANVPSDDNPKTGRITALSVIAAIRKFAGTVRIGT
jgi:aspartate dehydrogenase